MDTIDLTPTAEGYAAIGRRFVASILSDVKVSRRKDAAAILDSLLEITGYLAQTDPRLVAEIRREAVR